jgi:hypothetical protein
MTRAAEKHETQHMDLKTARIGWQMLPEPLRFPLRLHRHHLLQQHDEEGLVHPLDMGIMEVTYIKLSLSRAS